MPRYTNERKSAVLKKLLPPNNESVPDVALTEGISAGTLYNFTNKRCVGILLNNHSSITTNPDAEQYVARLHATGARVYDDINKCTQHCVAWRTADQVPGRALTVGGCWPPAQEIYTARDSLTYRLSSLTWHINVLRDVQKAEALKISEAELRRDIDPNISLHALMRIGYVFDNIIFNSVSAFDYLAKYICRIHFPSASGPQLEWRKLRLTNARSKLEDRVLSDLIETIDANWFRPLDRLRGDIIHNGAEVGGMRLETQHGEDGLVHSIEFNMPEKAIEILPVFEGNPVVAIEPGSAIIMLNSLQYISQIIRQMNSFEYLNMHDPLQPDRMRKTPIAYSCKVISE